MSAPTVSAEDVHAAIKGEDYTILPDGRTTICTLTLDNGYTVRGESSCVCIENFDAKLGRVYARDDATRKVWPLLGFRLADRLARERRGIESAQRAGLQALAEQKGATSP